MPDAPRPIVVALLGTRVSSASTIYGFYDLLASAVRDWEMLHGAREALSPFRPLVVSRDGRSFVAANGATITPDACLADVPSPAVACVTDVAMLPGESLGEQFDAEVAWLRACHANGGVVASACSGALLLARTGLLDGLEATSHWAYCDVLRREYPGTRWNAERGLVVGGPDGRIVMAGSGVAWHMLVLALIARFAGPEAAMRVARINLLDANATSALAYSSLTRGGPVADGVIAGVLAWVAQHYDCEGPVAQMVEQAGLPERTFKRRFTQSTGMSPLDYVHMVRLEEAKQMLEAGDQPVETIAVEVGYQDASFFSRLFRRKVGLTPAQYRTRFGALRRRIGAAPTGMLR